MFSFKNMAKKSHVLSDKEIQKNRDAIAREFANAVYDELVSDAAKLTLGIKTLVSKNGVNASKLSGSMKNKKDAYNEINELLKKFSVFNKSFTKQTGEACSKFFQDMKGAKDAKGAVEVVDGGLNMTMPTANDVVNALKNIDIDYKYDDGDDVNEKVVDLTLKMLYLSVSTFAINFRYASTLKK